MSEHIRILLVEDNPGDAGLIRELLPESGPRTFSIEVVPRLSAALERMETGNLDILLLDLGLPDSSGLGTFFSILKKNPELPVVVISGNSDDSVALEAVRKGAQDYLVKGQITEDLLTRSIRYAIERKKTDSALKKAQHVAHVGSWTWNIPENRVEWSDEMLRIFGIDKDNFTGDLAEVIARAIHPDDRAAVERSNDSVSRLKTPVPLEYRVILPDGTERTVWAEAGELVLDEQGNPLSLSGIVQDITERKRAEEALLIRGAAMDNAANAIVITDTRGTIIYTNPAFEKLTGYLSHEAVGKNPRELVKSGAQDDDFYRDMWEEILNGRVWHGEIKNRRKDGSVYDEEMTIAPVTGPNGDLRNFVAIKLDITERKFAEEIMALRVRLLKFSDTHTLDDLLREALDEIEARTGSFIGFYHFLLEDQETLSIQAWSTRTVREFCEAEGKGSHYDIGKAGVWADCVRQGRTVTHNDYASLPHRKGLPPGHAEIIRELIVPVKRNDRIVAVFGVGNKKTDYTAKDAETISYLADVTWEIVERKRAEIDLQTNYKVQESLNTILFRSLDRGTLDEILDAVLGELLSLEWLSLQSCGLILLADEEKRTLSLAAHRGLNDGLIEKLHRGALPFGSCLCGLAAETKKPVFAGSIDERHTVRYEGMSPHGHYCIPILHEKNVLGVLNLYVSEGHAYSSTEEAFLTAVANTLAGTILRKRAEASLEETLNGLERKVAERTADLEKSNRELESFSYTVSHDLRAPLRHISGFIELFRKETGESLSAKALHYMEVINDSARRMGQLIDDLLAFSRMGRTEIAVRRVEMNALLEEVLQGIADDIDRRNITFTRGPLPDTQGDVSMLRLVLANLVSNAVKFTMKTGHPVIEIGCDTNNGESVFYIRDNGVGFDMRYADKLFGVFQRLHPEKDYEGTGIGLATVQRIIQRHGGRVWAESEPDRGASFYFTLPAAN